MIEVNKVETVSELEKVTNCPWCKSANLKYLVDSQDLLLAVSEQVFQYCKCNDCGSLFQSLRPKDSFIGKYYSSSYQPHVKQNNNKKSMNSKINTFLGNGRATFVENVYKSKKLGKFLDFGCGAGTYLKKMQKKGWQVTGVDFSDQLLHGLRKDGFVVYNVNDKEWLQQNAGGFDLIRMNHVIEHLYNPVDHLRTLSGLLTEGGVLHIACPNSDSVFFKVFGNSWFPLDAPRHIQLPPSGVVISCLEQMGLNSPQVYFDSDPKDVLRSLGYWLSKRFSFSSTEIINWPGRMGLGCLLLWPMAFLSSIFKSSDRYDLFLHKGIKK